MINPVQVVVVGYGPVAARLVDNLLPAIRARRISCTVLGAEPVAAYNRIMLTEALAERADATRLALSDPAEWIGAGVDVRLDTRAVFIDRERRLVRTEGGKTVGYDHLVLATGSRSVIPALAIPGAGVNGGADGGGVNAAVTSASAVHTQVKGISALRDLADFRRIRSAVGQGIRVVVLGGGVLGVEAALAIAEHGNHTTLAHSGATPMARELDPTAGRVLAGELTKRAVRLEPQGRAVGVTTVENRFTGLTLHDGRSIPGELLLLTCGVRPRRELAAAAALPTDIGIVVDHQMTSPGDRRVHAIGDCAEVRCADPTCLLGCAPAGGPGRAPAGLIGAGWAQAEILAEVLTDPTTSRRFRHESPPMLVKAADLSVVSIGEITPDVFDSGGALSVSAWADPAAGQYSKIVVRDGRLAGAIVVGMPQTAAELNLLYDRQSTLPTDRSTLLRFDGPDADDSRTPDGPETVVCRCNAVTKAGIDHACAGGARTLDSLAKSTRAGTGCGGCRGRLDEILKACAPSTAPGSEVADGARVVRASA